VPISSTCKLHLSNLTEEVLLLSTVELKVVLITFLYKLRQFLTIYKTICEHTLSWHCNRKIFLPHSLQRPIISILWVQASI